MATHMDFDLEKHADMLKEVANIGTGNALSALSQLLGKKLRMDVPVANLVEFKDVANFIGGPDKLVVGVLVSMSGDLKGMMMFLVKQDSAHVLIRILLGEATEGNTLTDMEVSTLTEVGNILVASYLNSLAAMMNKTISLSLPSLAADMANSVLSVPAIEFGKIADKALFIESVFQAVDENVSGYFIFVPDMPSFDAMFKV